jgi:predicted  nucleic acid-binding Zn-ribbon protein
MSGRLSSTILFGVLMMVLIGSGLQSFQAGPQAQNPDTLAELLVEVRGLRAAMEQMATAGPRVQLAFGRLQLHEQRINGLVRRLDVVREKVRPALQEEDTLRAQLARFEAAAKSTTEFNDERKQIEAQLPGLRKAAARAAYDLQQLQTEESTLGNEIALEQGRWVQINQQLEELERTLVRR